MNTLLFTIEYPPFNGGVASYYGNMVRNWPNPDAIFVLHNNENQLLKRFIFPHWLPSFWSLFKSVKKNKIENVVVGQILPLGTVAYLLSFVMDFKYSIVIHGMDVAFAGRSLRKKMIAKTIMRRAHSIISSSTYTGELLVRDFGDEFAKKIKVVNPGVEMGIKIDEQQTMDLKKKYQTDGSVVVLSLGRLVKRKGVDKVIEAMPEVLKYFPNLKYFIGGDGPDREYLVEKARGLSNVSFLGRVSEEEKWSWLSICDIFAMPSRNIDGDFEGFGIVYLEAGLLGKPVVAGDSGGIRDAVLGAKTGILVNPEDVDDIANAILSLAKDPELRNRLGGAAQERILRDFNWEGQAGKVESRK